MSDGISSHGWRRPNVLHTKATLPIGSVLLSTVGTSLAVHGGLSVGTWALGTLTDRAEAKDWLWPTGSVVNAWYQSVGRAVLVLGVPFSAALSSLRWQEKLLLTGVTTWGLRLFYRIASRSVKRGKDDPRYEGMKRDTPSFWPKALFTLFLPEVFFQSIISLPFTLPFRLPPLESNYTSWITAAAVGLFGAGMALETLADYQLDAFKKDSTKKSKLCKEGVWSLVRHPNYLGDSLVHLSFGLLSIPAYSYDVVTSALLLAGPLANYAFLRTVGGDKQTEESQAERYAKEDIEKYGELQQYQSSVNAFWPEVKQLVSNKWSYIVGASGCGFVLLENLLRP